MGPLNRAVSKLGILSRAQATDAIRAGRCVPRHRSRPRRRGRRGASRGGLGRRPESIQPRDTCAHDARQGRIQPRGRGWLLAVTNVSITPYTYTEEFSHDDAVLSRDNLKIQFGVHTVWRIDESQVPLFMDRFSTTVSNQQLEK